jgi:tryptophan-rich sensory protein
MQLPSARTAGLLILCIAIPLVIGFIGSIATLPAITGWYAGLNKPAFNPPGWVFGPVWTLLYILMGIALFLVVKNGVDTAPVRRAVLVFAAQLLANLAWSFLFFGMHSIILGLLDILLLFFLIVATMILFRRISPVAAYLLIPSICWVTFASLLNAMIGILN